MGRRFCRGDRARTSAAQLSRHITSEHGRTEMMDGNTTVATAPPPVLFGRAGKKRKAYRQRTEAVDDEDSTERTGQHGDGTAAPAAHTRAGGSDGDDQKRDGDRRDKSDHDDGDHDMNDDTTAADNDDNDDDDDQIGIAVAELIRQRKARTRRQKLGGVEFRDSGDSGGPPRSGSSLLSLERGLVPRRADEGVDMVDADDDDALGGEPLPIGIRFAPPTGMVGEAVNKHMEAYVEAQMAKRYKAEALLRDQEQKQEQEQQQQQQQQQSRQPPRSDDAKSTELSRQQLAMKGKLHEVDLGAEARARNIALTERVAKAMAGGGGDVASAEAETNEPKGDSGGGGGGRQRLGRDGKPRPTCDRQRRGSDDVKRDQLVEEFLRENKLDVDVYDAEPVQPPQQEGRPTDDKIAEQFRREFMENMAQRMRRKRGRPLGAAAAKPNQARSEEEVLRGPKLGGSRNVRSVMRDKLLQKQEEQRQSMPKYEQQLQEERRKAIRRR